MLLVMLRIVSRVPWSRLNGWCQLSGCYYNLTGGRWQAGSRSGGRLFFSQMPACAAYLLGYNIPVLWFRHPSSSVTCRIAVLALVPSGLADNLQIW
jgi:hypothetical protein